MHLFFWFNNFLDARAEVREEIWLGESLRHHDFFLIFLDLYSFQHGISVSPQNLIKAFESNLKQFAPPPPMMELRRLILRSSKLLLGRLFYQSQNHGLWQLWHPMKAYSKEISKFGSMWQTKYASAVPKNLGLEFDFRLCSEDNFFIGCP